MLSRYSRLFSLLLILVVACRPASRGTEPQPAVPEIPPPIAPTRPLAPRNSWAILPTNQPHNYRSTITSILESGDRPLLVRDSTSIAADFSLTLTRETRGFSYSAILETFLVHGATRASLVPTEVSLPFSLNGHLESNQLTVDSPAKPEENCASQIISAIPVIQRAIVIVPLQLQRDMSWTDSTSAIVCSGSVPVTLIALRNYRVLGETSLGTRQAILLERQDRTLSTGEGAEGQHRIQLKSEGSGQTQLFVDTVTGSLIETTGTNITTLIVTTSGRSQRFVQTSREHITER